MDLERERKRRGRRCGRESVFFYRETESDAVARISFLVLFESLSRVSPYLSVLSIKNKPKTQKDISVVFSPWLDQPIKVWLNAEGVSRASRWLTKRKMACGLQLASLHETRTKL